jgi:hypothetical protein
MSHEETYRKINTMARTLRERLDTLFRTSLPENKNSLDTHLSEHLTSLIVDALENLDKTLTLNEYYLNNYKIYEGLKFIRNESPSGQVLFLKIPNAEISGLNVETLVPFDRDSTEMAYLRHAVCSVFKKLETVDSSQLMIDDVDNTITYQEHYTPSNEEDGDDVSVVPIELNKNSSFKEIMFEGNALLPSGGVTFGSIIQSQSDVSVLLKFPYVSSSKIESDTYDISKIIRLDNVKLKYTRVVLNSFFEVGFTYQSSQVEIVAKEKIA